MSVLSGSCFERERPASFKALGGKWGDRGVFLIASPEPRCDVSWFSFKGNSSHIFFVCFIMWFGGDVTGRCETELTRTLEVLLTSVWNVDAIGSFLEGPTPKHLDGPLVAG